MSPESVVRLLAEPARLRVFAAITLGAATSPRIAEASGLAGRDVAVAVRKLSEGGLVRTEGAGLAVRADVFRELARRSSPPRETAGDSDVDAVLRRYVRADRLVDFPAQWSRKLAVLGHLTARTFTPGERYDEKVVDARLTPWCEGAPIDRVSVRRYLVEAGFLSREHGVYWVTRL